MNTITEHVCHICSAAFETRSWLTKHMLKKHELTTLEAFKQKNKLSDDYIKLCECGCGNVTTFTNNAGRGFARFIVGHSRRCLRKEGPQLPRPLQCPICTMRYRAECAIVRHAMHIHEITKEALCVMLNNSGTIMTAKLDPLCKCGCGKRTSFRTFTQGYANWRSGHNNVGKRWIHTPESHRRSGQTRARLRREGKIVNWNQGLTKDTDERVRRAGQSISKAKKGKPRSRAHSVKINAIMRAYWSDPRNRDAQRQRTVERIRGQRQWCGQGTRHRVEHDGNVWLLKSSYELEALRILQSDPSNVRIEYETVRIGCADGTTYVPDFIVTSSDGTVRIIEIKSTFWMGHPRWQRKLDALVAYASEHGAKHEVWTERTHPIGRPRTHKRHKRSSVGA